MVRSFLDRYRQLLGVLIKDLRRYRQAMARPGTSYLALCNRNEVLDAAPGGAGYRCTWRWTSDLHAPKVLPALGLRLMERALDEHPICRAATPECGTQPPFVSFVIGHRGLHRLPQLLATLESIAGQREERVECLVIEQDSRACIGGALPGWVRYIHSPPPAADMPYCRSWAFNIGARRARGEVLVLHDNDMLVPADYAASIRQHVRAGYEIANVKRFVFYLTEQHTKAIFGGSAGVTDQPPLVIVQNLEGGGSVAVTRQAYEELGGFDETFIGWGGEDNEFWERAQTRRVWPYAYLPIVHLWHAPQVGKYQPASQTRNHYQTLSHVPAQTRIEQLRKRPAGELAGPSGWT